MTRAKRICGLTLAVLALLVPSSAMAEECGRTNIAPAAATDHQLRSSTLCLINRIRENRGIPPLAYNEALRHSATAHSINMVRSGIFSHYGPSGSTPATRVARAGYLARVSYFRLAENIGAGEGRRYGSPAAIVSLWMHSAGHRENLLDRGLHDFGIGVARGNPFGGSRQASATYTLDLGARSRS